MKIVVGDKVYLQKLVMAFIEEEFYVVPGALHLAFIQNYAHFSIRGSHNTLSFGCEFTDEESVEFLKGCEYIFDFVEYSKKTVKELQAEMNERIATFEERASYYDQADDSYKEENGEAMRCSFDETRLMCEQIKMMIACKTGQIKFPALPEGVEANLEVE